MSLFWDKSFLDPAANLAADEALLDHCDEQDRSTLRFWESEQYFVVLGYSNYASAEANVAACQDSGVPIFRRCSGGGAVLQGKGCLNYSLVLPVSEQRVETIPSTNRFIMQKHRDALATLLPGQVSVEGCTDLCWNGLKFSGNSQRRKKNALLFHGTFLLDFDLPQIEKFLRSPSRQPDYRQQRAHRDFVTNIPVSREAIKAALRETWSAGESLDLPPDLDPLIAAKYGREDWNLRY